MALNEIFVNQMRCVSAEEKRRNADLMCNKITVQSSSVACVRCITSVFTCPSTQEWFGMTLAPIYISVDIDKHDWFRQCVWRKLDVSVKSVICYFYFAGLQPGEKVIMVLSLRLQLRPFISRCGVSWTCMILIRWDHLPMCSHVMMSKSEHTWTTVSVMRSHTTSVASQYDLTAIHREYFIKQCNGNTPTHTPPHLHSTLYPLKYHDQILFAGVHLYTWSTLVPRRFRSLAELSLIIFNQQPITLCSS